MTKNHIGALIEKNAIVDEGEGYIRVKGGLTLTDESVQHNGTKYDVKTLDLSEYDGRLFANHGDGWNGYTIETVIGKLVNVAKKGKRVVAEGIQYAVNASPLALYAYNMTKEGYLTDFSIGTSGPWPDEEDDTYRNHAIFEVSQVGIANNKNAHLNKAELSAIATNSIEQAKKNGMDTTELEKVLKIKNDSANTKPKGDASKKNDTPEEQQVNGVTTIMVGDKEVEIPYTTTSKMTDDGKIESEISVDTSKVEAILNDLTEEEIEDMTYVSIKNTRDFAVPVSYKNAAGEEVTVELAVNASVDVSDDQKEAVENQLKDAKNPAEEATPLSAEALNKMLADALKPLSQRLEEIEENGFDKGAQSPEFKKNDKKDDDKDPESRHTNAAKELESMDWHDRHAKQINAAWDMLKNRDMTASQTLRQINEVHLAKLKKEGVVPNSMTIADFGNFVISREMLTEIEGCRNDYSTLVNATNWKETLSTQFAWLKRSGDINMQSVEFCDDNANGNLKPLSEYTATIQTADLEELAAVTPVCNAATRFLAADLLGDVAQGYRTDYDRKRAQLVVARLEQAVEANGNSTTYDTNPTVNALTSWVDTWAEIATCTPNGTFIFSTRTYAEVMRKAVQAGVNGPLANIFVTGNVPTIFGRPFIVLPDDLMPALDTASTVTIQVDGVNVTVNHAVYYADLNNFTGRTSGGLQYDLSTEAAYEDNGTTKSSFQRNELLLRGSFFRGGAILDTDQVAGILSPGVS